jgi:hypothetical protein
MVAVKKRIAATQENATSRPEQQREQNRLALAVELLGLKFQLFDFERTLTWTLKKRGFFKDENNHSFSVYSGLPSVRIQ